MEERRKTKHHEYKNTIIWKKNNIKGKNENN
jgi:hypothetical protein